MPLVHIFLVLTVVEKAFIRLLSDWSLNHTGLNQSCATLATLFSFLFVLLSAWVRRNLELWIETQESRVKVTGHGSLAAGSTFDGVISSRAHIPRVFAQCPVGLAAGHCRVRRTLSSWYFCLWMFVCVFLYRMRPSTERRKNNMASTFSNVTSVLSCISMSSNWDVNLLNYRPVHLLKMKRFRCQPMSAGSGSSVHWSLMDSFTWLPSTSLSPSLWANQRVSRTNS